MEYDNTNRGALFKNDRKETDVQPDYRGKINVNGTDMWISAWIKEGKSGKFMSLSVSEMNANGSAKPQSKTQPTKENKHFDDIVNDIPF